MSIDRCVILFFGYKVKVDKDIYFYDDPRWIKFNEDRENCNYDLYLMGDDTMFIGKILNENRDFYDPNVEELNLEISELFKLKLKDTFKYDFSEYFDDSLQPKYYLILDIR